MKLFNWFSKSKIQEIGKIISWRDSIGLIFKVTEFDSQGTIIDSRGNVKAKSVFNPYGYLIVDTPSHEGSFRLPIIHRDDFLLASSIFDDPNFASRVKTHDLLVTYRPKTINQNGLAGVHH